MKGRFARSFNFDKGFGLFCISVAALFGYGTYTMEEAAAFQQIGPRHWPAVLSIVLGAIGAALLLGAAETADTAAVEDIGVRSATQEAGPIGAVWILCLGMLLSIPIMALIGYWPAGAFLMAIVLFLKETKEHIVRSTLCALITPAAVYYLFTSVFEQYLPRGMLLP